MNTLCTQCGRGACVKSDTSTICKCCQMLNAQADRIQTESMSDSNVAFMAKYQKLQIMNIRSGRIPEGVVGTELYVKYRHRVEHDLITIAELASYEPYIDLQEIMHYMEHLNK